jgi:hypothetical protein
LVPKELSRWHFRVPALAGTIGEVSAGVPGIYRAGMENSETPWYVAQVAARSDAAVVRAWAALLLGAFVIVIGAVLVLG